LDKLNNRTIYRDL